MVKYSHCEKCKSIYNTETWIGEVHVYEGVCPSCLKEEKEEGKNQISPIRVEEPEKVIEEVNDVLEPPQLELERITLSSLEQRAHDVYYGEGSIYVLIKEINDDLVRKAKERIDQAYESFDINKKEAQKIVTNVETILEYLGEYKLYMDKLVEKLQIDPKIKIKTAIDKVFKESISNLPKQSKKIFQDKKIILKKVYDKSIDSYNRFSEIGDIFELTKQMSLDPFNEIREKLSNLPFYGFNQ